MEISEQVLEGISEADVLERFRQANLPVSALHPVDKTSALRLRRLRGDLVQPNFQQESRQPLLVGRK